MIKLIDRFWLWYEKNYKVNLKLAAFLFFWQLIHLLWLAIVIVLPRIFNFEPPKTTEWFNLILAIVDYSEIPAIVSVSLLYINDLRKDFNFKPLWFLLFLNSQWLHLFWITDEFIIKVFVSGTLVYLPIWLIWFAILIDYLELPVMWDTLKRYLSSRPKKD